MHQMSYFVVFLFVFLPSRVGHAFDGFMHGKDLHSSSSEFLSNLLFQGVSQKCNETIRGLDINARWRCKD